MYSVRMTKLVLLLGITLTLLSSQANAWYNASLLEDCDPVQKWDVAEHIEQISLGPLVSTAPFSEGEFYSTEDKNVTFECLLPKLPPMSYISLTFNSTYVANMKTAVVRRRPFCITEEGRVQEKCEIVEEQDEVPTSETDSEDKNEACTIAVFAGETMDRIDPIPEHLPTLCSTERISGLQAAVNLNTATPHLTLSISKVQLEQTGTYQCSALRSCNPAFNSALLEEQEALAVSKSLFLKVYPFPDYRSDMVVASTALAIASLVMAVTVMVSRRTKDPVDHL